MIMEFKGILYTLRHNLEVIFSLSLCLQYLKRHYWDSTKYIDVTMSIHNSFVEINLNFSFFFIFGKDIIRVSTLCLEVIFYDYLSDSFWKNFRRRFLKNFAKIVTFNFVWLFIGTSLSWRFLRIFVSEFSLFLLRVYLTFLKIFERISLLQEDFIRDILRLL